ncbi:oxamate carbamoyltransferase subunit AllH family protein [Pimelobacter simplex]|uniref:oxamate carbamoyltransferase subunit AllH family protein n=1 Tax=Nocardioides simplex TaxID=2045 RepID=UPI001C206C5F|nr:DUF2877 domain-containing protein [Pimelobacter simplex]
MPDPALSSSTLPPGRVAGAGGAALRALLAGPPAVGTVLHAGREAVYVRLGERVVGVVARGAVHVPSAIATTLAALPEVAVGDPVPVGDGVLRLAGLSVGVDRIVATDAPALPDPAAAGERLAAAGPDFDVVRRQLPAEALDALAAGDPAAVRALLGRGDGLTPVGDDVLSGWLVTTRAAGGDPDAVALAVRADAHRTTALSATLLADAIDGASIPPFRRLLLALGTGREVTAAVTALRAVGHTSGAGMLLGALLALRPPVPSSPATPLEGSPR